MRGLFKKPIPDVQVEEVVVALGHADDGGANVVDGVKEVAVHDQSVHLEQVIFVGRRVHRSQSQGCHLASKSGAVPHKL